MDWFLYDNGLRHGRVNNLSWKKENIDLWTSYLFLVKIT